MHHSATIYGTLYIVATPIGNRDDISIRALQTLQSVDAILAEDTRHSAQFLTLMGIKRPIISLHAHNEAHKSERMVDMLLEGRSLALISDAGTPLISDPGFPLVKLAQSKGITVCPIPGPCALIAALSASGIPCDEFIFSGFLPAKQAARRIKLASFLSVEQTVIFYESTHRILDSVDDICTVFGDDCEWVLAKELTKTFERFVTGTSARIKTWLLSDPLHCKGEFVVMLPPRTSMAAPSNSINELLSVLLQELPLKQAVTLTCQLTKKHKNKIYELALALKAQMSDTRFES